MDSYDAIVYLNDERHYHRTCGPAMIHNNGGYAWFVDGKRYRSIKTYQEAAGLSDEEMSMMVLKYGNIL
jgi:hypothetical protein